MRKIISLALITLLSLAMLFTLTGCSNNNGESADNNAKELENYTSASMLDKVTGYEVTVNYPNDGTVELTDAEKNYINLAKADENLKMNINRSPVYQTNYDSNKKSYESKDGYKEVTYGNYSGYIYIDSYDNINMTMIVGDAGEQKMSVTFKVSKIDSKVETDMTQAIDSNFIKDIAEHIVYNNQAEKYSVDGTISGNGIFYVKPLSQDSYTNTLKEETTSSGVDISLLDGEKNCAVISVDSNVSTNLDDAIKNESKTRTYTDTTVAGFQAKVWDNSEKYASENKTFKTYYVLKDSKVYMIVVQTFNSFSQETTDKLLEDTVANIVINDAV